MKIILRHIRNNILEKKFRSIATMLFLILISTVIYINLSMPSIVRQQYERVNREIYGDIDLALFKENAEPFAVDRLNLKDVEYESLVTIEKSAYMKLNSDQKSIYIVGAAPEDAVRMRFIHDRDVTTLKENEAVISVKTAKKLGITVGDSFSVTTSTGKEKDLKVVETIQEEGYFSMDRDSNFVFVTYDTAESIFGLEGKVSYDYLKIKSEGLSEITEKLSKRNPSFFVYQIIDEDAIVQSVNNILYLFILVFLVLFTMLFYAIATLNRSILRDRVHAMAVLKSLGASSSSLSVILGTESVIYGLISGFAGSMIGGLLMKFIPVYFEDSVVKKGIQNSFQLKTTLIVVGTVIVIQLLLSMGAIRTITKKSLLDMRKQENVFIKNYLIQMISGIAVIFIGISLYIYYPLNNSVIFIFEMLCFLFGISLIIPLLFYMLSWLIEKFLRLFSNRLLSFSALNVRTKSMLADHVRLITVNVTLFILLITFSASFISYFNSFEGKVKADYIVSYVTQPKNQYEDLNRIDGVKGSSLLFLNQAMMKRKEESTSITICSNYDYDKQGDYFKGYEVYDGNCLQLKEDEIILDKHITELYGLKEDDIVTLQTGSGIEKKNYKFKLKGTCDGSGIALSRLVGVISQVSYEAMFGDVPQYIMLDMENSKASIESIKDKLPDALSVVETKDKFVNDKIKLLRIFVRIIIAVTICGLAGCFLGLICNQRNIIEDREKDLAILYTTCMTKKNILQMIIIEEIIISIFALLFSFAGSAMLYRLLSRLLDSMYLCFPLHFYVGRALIATGGVLILLFLFIVGCTDVKLRKADYINIIKKDATM